MRFKIGDKVRIKGRPEMGVCQLRSLSMANRELKAKGWIGYVAHLQNRTGTTIQEYRKLTGA